jgi:maltooligosyltrehalose synthase
VGDVVPVAEEVMPVEATSTEAAPTRSARKRSSLSRSIFGSMFGTVFETTGESATAAQSVSLSAQSDVRKLVAAITSYRTTLSEQQRVEFDGEFIQSVQTVCLVVITH